MNFFKIILSAGLSFFIAIGVALLIEKLGGALGSVIGTIPTTLIPSIYLILSDSNQTIQYRTDSTLATVFGIFATDLFFMPTWKILPPRLPKTWKNGKKVLVTTLVAIFFWLIGAIIIVSLQSLAKSMGIKMWTFSICTVLIAILFGVCLCWRLPPTPAGKNSVKWYTHLCRGIAAFCTLFISGILSQSGLGVVAGAMATFPALFLTAMVSVSLSQRAEVATGAIGPLILGSISGATFGLSCAFFLDILHLSPGWCCACGFVVAVCCWSIPIYFFIKWRRDATTAKTMKMVKKMEDENAEKIEMKEIPSTENKDIPSSNEVAEVTTGEPEVFVSPTEQQNS